MNHAQAFKSILHISYSQIWTYLECSLKYRFQYVEKQPPEKLSIALYFGLAMHTCVERYYNRLVQNQEPEKLDVLKELFREKITADVVGQKMPVIYKKETPDLDSAIELGGSLLETFYNSIDMSGMEIIAVELPLSAMITPDIALVGRIDLLLRDIETQKLIITDTKTAAKPKAQADVDSDLQLSGYSYLLVENNYASKSDEIACRLDVLRKLKTPKLEHCYTSRNLWHRRRFNNIALAVLAGIESRVFIPARSWLCSDCQYAIAFSRWEEEENVASPNNS